MVTTLFYPVYLALAFTMTLLLIPRQHYKEYFIYGLLIGGLGDIVVVGLFQHILHIIQFKNAGIFNIMGFNYLSPPSWLCTVMLYLHFLPRRRPFLYLYVLTFAAFSDGYGILVHNANLFDFRSWFYPIFSFITFFGWWSFTAWVFLKTSPLAKTD